MKELYQKNVYQKIGRILKEADAILIGASNGLSITEGLHLFAENDAFYQLFGDYSQKYGFQCLLHGMMNAWPTEEEKWGFWSRLIHHYCGRYHTTETMRNLRSLTKEKDCFVITSNGECHFEMSGFAAERVYEIEGTWLSMQCADACHTKLYPVLELAEQMAAAQKQGMVPTELLPRCPVCGGAMKIHMDDGQNFITDEEAKERFFAFLKRNHGKKLAILELGIGWRNQLIKAPLMKLAESEPQASYITVNLGEVFIPDSIREKSIGVNGDIAETLQRILDADL